MLQIRKVLCRCAATLLQNISIACTIEFKNIILSLMVKFWAVIKWENWILHFAANFCNLQQLCCMPLALLKMQRHGFKKFVLRNLFYVYQNILLSFNRETINTFAQDTVVFPMKQQLSSNFNLLKITFSTTVAEAIFCIPLKFFSNF